MKIEWGHIWSFMLDDILDAISKHFGIEPEGDCDIKPKKKKGKGKKKKKKLSQSQQNAGINYYSGNFEVISNN